MMSPYILVMDVGQECCCPYISVVASWVKYSLGWGIRQGRSHKLFLGGLRHNTVRLWIIYWGIGVSSPVQIL